MALTDRDSQLPLLRYSEGVAYATGFSPLEVPGKLFTPEHPITT